MGRSEYEQFEQWRREKAKTSTRRSRSSSHSKTSTTSKAERKKTKLLMFWIGLIAAGWFVYQGVWLPSIEGKPENPEILLLAFLIMAVIGFITALL